VIALVVLMPHPIWFTALSLAVMAVATFAARHLSLGMGARGGAAAA